MKISIIILFLILLVFSFSHLNCLPSTTKIRNFYVAGSFYPASPQQLEKTIKYYLGLWKKSNDKRRPLVIFCPHAGYIYSAKTAAAAYKQLEGFHYDTVIVIGPSHHFRFQGYQIYDGDFYETPLGNVPIDKDIVKELTKLSPVFFTGHQYEKGEHSVEVQIPFLQTVLKNFKLVPILAGSFSYLEAETAAEALAKLYLNSNKKILIVISSDYSHYYTLSKAHQLDFHTRDLILQLKTKQLYQDMVLGKAEACGIQGIMTALEFLKLVPHTPLEVLTYDTSASTTQDKDRVVGYFSFISRVREKLNKEEEKILLNLARKTLETYLTTGKRPQPPHLTPLLKEKRGVFVTLKKNGILRGCIGYIVPIKPLWEAVIDNAINAAVNDPRFPPVNPSELKDIKIEISVLTPFRETTPDKIKIGRDGLILKYGFHQGVFLPQVPVEWHWDLKTYLDELCRKAGVPKGSWKKPGAHLYSFEAQVFSEDEIK